MPFYELAIVVKPLPRKETVAALRRAAQLLWNEDGVLRKVEYLGYRKFPFKGGPFTDEKNYTEGDYFIWHVSAPHLGLKKILPELKLDTDLIRAVYFDEADTRFPEGYECTLEEELQTPFYRKSVQPLLGNKNVRLDVRDFESVKRLPRS